PGAAVGSAYADVSAGSVLTWSGCGRRSWRPRSRWSFLGVAVRVRDEGQGGARPGPVRPAAAAGRGSGGRVVPGRPLGVCAEYPGGIGGGLGPALHAELGEYAGDVVLDGLLGQEEPVADLPVGQSFADELEDAPLLVGEPGQRVGPAGLVTRAVPGPVGGPGAEQGLARGDGADR